MSRAIAGFQEVDKSDGGREVLRASGIEEPEPSSLLVCPGGPARAEMVKARRLAARAAEEAQLKKAAALPGDKGDKAGRSGQASPSPSPPKKTPSKEHAKQKLKPAVESKKRKQLSAASSTPAKSPVTSQRKKPKTAGPPQKKARRAPSQQEEQREQNASAVHSAASEGSAKGKIPAKRELSAVAQEWRARLRGEDKSDDLCSVCEDGGALICCEGPCCRGTYNRLCELRGNLYSPDSGVAGSVSPRLRSIATNT